ncbi:MAG: NigD-like C-terminal domain-containing protein [Flavobacteriales bacterium]
MKKIGIAILAGAILLGACKKNKEVTATSSEKEPERQMLVVNQLQVNMDYRPTKTDPFQIVSAVTEGDSLIVMAQYGGGCEVHEFSLMSNGLYLKSLPMQLNLTIEHKANNDMCRALLTQRLAFDISSVKQKSSKEILLIINDDSENKVTYKY